jgi:hypothetical protein
MQSYLISKLFQDYRNRDLEDGLRVRGELFYHHKPAESGVPMLTAQAGVRSFIQTAILTQLSTYDSRTKYEHHSCSYTAASGPRTGGDLADVNCDRLAGRYSAKVYL